MDTEDKPVDRFIRLTEVMQMTALKRSMVYRLIKDDLFPAPVPVGERAVVWIKSEVEAWQASKIAIARSKDASTPNNSQSNAKLPQPAR